MLERDTEWRQFYHLITDTALSADQISQNTGIPLRVVTGFRQQYQGRSFLDTNNDSVPVRLRRYAVGFRYQHLGRWMNTPAEKKARDDYDAGLTEMAQGKFKVGGEDAYVLFSIPRRIPVKGRRLYFSAPVFS